MITAVFGGVLRDIVCNDIPSAFSDHRPYALCAFFGGWTLVGLWALGTPHWASLLASAAVTTSLRVWAMTSGFTLPQWGASKD
jgi:uncharacterized membrane protein YeiH